MGTLYTSVSLLLVALALGSTGCERQNVHVAILLDRSLSSTAGCESVLGVAGELRARAGRDTDLHVSVFGTGDVASANEPAGIGAVRFGAVRRVLEGRHRVEQDAATALRDLDARCRQVEHTSRSPIALGIRRSIEHVRTTAQCSVERCAVILIGDGLETEQADIRAALKSNSTAQVPQGIIDNTNVSVTFCGLAQLAANAILNGRHVQVIRPRSLADAERVQTTWRAAFTDQTTVSFSPTCPKGSVPTALPPAHVVEHNEHTTNAADMDE